MRGAMLLIVCFLLLSCSAGTPGEGSVLVKGRLIDDETGQPVQRTTIWVHAFCDDVGKQVSLEPGDDESTFALRLPTRSVRLRIADVGDEYALWERNFELDGDALDQDMRLTPLHWIRLHGRILRVDASGRLQPLPRYDGGMGSRPIVSFEPGGRVHEDDSASSYWVRVPRERIDVRVVDSAQGPETPAIDLTGVTDAERAFDVILR